MEVLINKNGQNGNAAVIIKPKY